VIVAAVAALATGGLKTPGAPSPGRRDVGLEAFAVGGFDVDVCFLLGAFGEREAAGLFEGETPGFGRELDGEEEEEDGVGVVGRVAAAGFVAGLSFFDTAPAAGSDRVTGAGSGLGAAACPVAAHINAPITAAARLTRPAVMSDVPQGTPEIAPCRRFFDSASPRAGHTTNPSIRECLSRELLGLTAGHGR
jgi:hypothetical protein